MRSRGRKSAANLSVLTATIAPAPLLPPDGLTDAERAVWRQTVGALPGGYFGRESAELLAAHCRHAATARTLSAHVAAFRPEWLAAEGGLDRLDRLLKMREREGRAALAHARALRITAQARTDPKTAGRRSSGHVPSIYDVMGADDDETF